MVAGGAAAGDEEVNAGVEMTGAVVVGDAVPQPAMTNEQISRITTRIKPFFIFASSLVDDLQRTERPSKY